MKDIFAAKDYASFPELTDLLPKTGSKNLLQLGNEVRAIEEKLAHILSSKEENVQKVCQHLISAEGKRLRPILVCLSGQFGKYNFEKVVTLGTAVEILHMATLIHDDIIDKADLRRGRATVNKAWDQDVAILIGDYLYGKALILLGTLGKAIITGFSDIVTKLIEGEMEQKVNRYNPNITLEQYKTRIHNKTAFFISQCCGLGALACEANTEVFSTLEKYGSCLGLAFQIQDDLMDFTEERTSCGKPVQEDLKKGVLTLPIIYAIGQSDRQEELKQIISKGNYSKQDWGLILEEIKKTEAISYGRDLARYYAREARESLYTLPEGTSKDSLKFLTYFVTERKK